jgi:uncharacterized protein YecT (DUF1311 family)
VRRLAVLLALLLAAPAAAQDKPSFDCAKASNAIERTICGTPELARADRDMASVYVALSGGLSGPAKEHLLKDQMRWIAARNKACDGVAETLPLCLKQHFEARTANLRIFGDGLYPFVSEQTAVKAGKFGRIAYSIDAAWPQFDGSSADFKAVNRSFASDTSKGIEEATPTSDAAVGDPRDQIWTLQQWFELQRPSARAIAVAISSYTYTGGAHPYGGTWASLVDLRTGRFAGPAEVFKPGDNWLKALVQLVQADLKKQFAAGHPGFDDAIGPDKLAKSLRDPGHYLYRPGGLQLIFNPDEIGPYAAGKYEVNIPYATLRPLFAPDGPLGSL